MSAVLDILSWLLIGGGGAFCIIGGIGLIRMPDFYTRVHAASVTETLGAGLMLLGLMLQAGFTLACAKLVLIAVLILFMSPTATHALTRAALLRGLDPVLADDGGEPSKR
ncbi:MAG: monovalent cation/H(+) antiporter subunit G [Betaproteobacteria bacterium]|nr:MAG: monovalent cation/H(+) antiporter subunit G [Betaproteobacteria bacterium]